MKKRLAIITTAIIMLLQTTSLAAPAVEEFYGTNFNALNNNDPKTVTGSVLSQGMSGWTLENSVANATVSCVNVGTEESPNYALQYSNTNSNAMLKYTWGYWSTKNKSINFDIKIVSGGVKIAARDQANAWKTARDILTFTNDGNITIVGTSTQLYRVPWTTGNWYNVNIIIDNSNSSGVAPAVIEIRSGNKNGTLLRKEIVQIPAPGTAGSGAMLVEFVTKVADTTYILDNPSFGRVYDRALAENQGQCSYPASNFRYVGNHSQSPLVNNIKGGTAYIEYAVKDFEGSPVDPTVLAGIYDENGELIAFAKGTANLTSGVLNKLAIDVPLEAFAIRGFVWDMNDISPIERMIGTSN